jgi:membrane protein implicated in regulation of membrane protease activity
MEMFYILNHWHWWALASLLIIGELLAPCLYMAMGIAAMLVGLVVRFMPDLGGQWQLGLFIVLCLISTGIARNIRSKRAKRSPEKDTENLR